MSCYWHIWCHDCKERLTFDNANHALDVMKDLVELREVLGNLHLGKMTLAKAGKPYRRLELDVVTSWGERVDLEWFHLHAAHQFEPISEYGELATAYMERSEKFLAEQRERDLSRSGGS